VRASKLRLKEMQDKDGTKSLRGLFVGKPCVVSFAEDCCCVSYDDADLKMGDVLCNT
jgi:hypothetical protein